MDIALFWSLLVKAHRSPFRLTSPALWALELNPHRKREIGLKAKTEDDYSFQLPQNKFPSKSNSFIDRKQRKSCFLFTRKSFSAVFCKEDIRVWIGFGYLQFWRDLLVYGFGIESWRNIWISLSSSERMAGVALVLDLLKKNPSLISPTLHSCGLFSAKTAASSAAASAAVAAPFAAWAFLG